jgi:WD40 repeat protein
VVDTGLEDTQIVLTGESYRVSATISPAGDVLAMPSPTGNVALYDLPQTIAQGSGIQVGTLEGSKLTKKPDWDYHQAFFTTDGKQVVVIYTGVSALVQGGGNVGVWELATRTLLRELPFDNGTRAYTVSNAPSTGPVWVVMGKIETVTTDAGTYDQTTVSLRDTSATVTTTPSFVVPSEVYRAAFSADNRVLAIGTSDGEISLWDLSTLNNIQRLGSPLVAGGTRDSVYGLAFSPDGQFLTAGSSVYEGAKSLWIINLQSRSVVKRDISWSPRAFAFATDHTTWAYGLGGCGFVYFCK